MGVGPDEIGARPEDGCFIRGLFMEGARWDAEAGQIGESKNKELFSEVPVVWLRPLVNKVQKTAGIYVCPVYKTITRAGECPGRMCGLWI
jgi:dynein heavy chain